MEDFAVYVPLSIWLSALECKLREFTALSPKPRDMLATEPMLSNNGYVYGQVGRWTRTVLAY